ncbi:MAG: hypothetical protein QXW58_02990 [Thermosphaera sp.]
MATNEVPVDKEKLHLLGDVTYEADLLLRAKYLETITGGLSGFKEFLSKRNRGTFLLTSNFETGRISVLIENGKVASTLYIDSTTGERRAGEDSLNLFLELVARPDSVFRVFEIRESREETTPAQEPVRETSTARQPLEKVPQIPSGALTIDSDKLQQFKKEFRQIAVETAEAFGCRIVDLTYEIVGNDLTISIILKKKGIFGKCLEDELAETLRNDLPLLRDNFDLKLNINLKTSLME